MTDEGLAKMLRLAFSAEAEAHELVERRNKAAHLAGEAFLRGQEAFVAGRIGSARDVLVIHRSWDDCTLRMVLNPDLLERAADRHNTHGASLCILTECLPNFQGGDSEHEPCV